MFILKRQFKELSILIMSEQTQTIPSKPSLPIPSKLPKSFILNAGANQSNVQIPDELTLNSSLDEIFLYARKLNASDIHLSINYPVLVRQFQSLKAITKENLSRDCIIALMKNSFNPAILTQFMAQGGVEFVYAIDGGGRYRITLMKTRSGLDLTARIIPLSIRSFEESEMPKSCKGLTKWAQGLVLIAGPAGCGKTTTLSTLVEMINQTRTDHIVTIENPIEVLYSPKKCQITQREIGMHTLSQASALKAALREDPDVIIISELRDLDTIRLAVTAAETGHLVFGTMNALSASQTISNLIDSFPPEEQSIITVMISESLRGVICQQLIPTKDRTKMVPAFEVLMFNNAVSNMIRTGKIQNLPNTIATGKSDGMVLFDNYLKDLLSKNIIDPQEACSRAANPKDFEQYLTKQ